MKKFLKSEKLIYIIITAAFMAAFFTVYLKTEQKLDIIRQADPVVIHDITTEKDNVEHAVYITPSGKKYHLEGCKFLSEKQIKISLEDAVNAKYEACKYCQP